MEAERRKKEKRFKEKLFDWFIGFALSRGSNSLLLMDGQDLDYEGPQGSDLDMAAWGLTKLLLDPCH